MISQALAPKDNLGPDSPIVRGRMPTADIRASPRSSAQQKAMFSPSFHLGMTTQTLFLLNISGEYI